MKKFFTFFLSMLMAGGAFAQERPDRMIVYEANGQKTSYLAERVDSVKFVQVEGQATADIELLNVGVDTLSFSVTRNGICEAFKFNIISKVKASRLSSDVAMAGYMHANGGQMYWQDFTNGQVSTADLKSATDYVAVTLAYDSYGTPCSVSRVPFTTKAKPLAGSPKVEYTVDSIGMDAFKITFRPNKDVGGYAVVAGEKGVVQDQFGMFGPMMNVDNFGELIKAWGVPSDTVRTVTWDDFAPSTDYEVFLQAWDTLGVFLPCDTIAVRTKMKGGEGEAFVTTSLGAYKNTPWDIEGQQVMLPSQFIKFTPNDQTNCYRLQVVLDSLYQKDPEGFQNELPVDPPFPIVGYFHYDEVEADFQINPSTKFVVLTVAKNGLNKWGKIKVDTYETPAAVIDPSQATVKKVSSTSYEVGTRLKTKRLPALTKGSAPVVRKGEIYTTPRLVNAE